MDDKLDRLLRSQQVMGLVVVVSLCVTTLLVVVRSLTGRIIWWSILAIVPVSLIALLWGQRVRRKAKGVKR